MSNSQEQIKNIIENLSKLSLGDGKQHEDLAKIIGYMDILSEVDTTGVEPTVSVSSFEKSLRVDSLAAESIADEILKCSPQSVIARQVALNNIMH